MKKILSLLVAIFLSINFTGVFAADLSGVIVTPIKGNVLTLDSEITDIIGGKSVVLNMSLEVNNKYLLTLGGNEYIKYTLDGSAPEKGEYYYYYSGPVSPQYQESYTNEINLTEEGTYTLRAIAQKSGCTSEEYATKIKVDKISTPAITLDNNVVTIKTNTSGVTIYYTTNGDEPTISSQKYTEPICLKESTLLKAIAVKKGYATSDIAKKHIAIEIKKDSYTECNICGAKIATDNIVYDEDNQPFCQQCADEISNDKEQYIELECPHCSEILEIAEADFNERENIVCPDCMKFIIYEGEDTEYECSDCGEIFYYSDTKVVENGKIYCPYCNCIVDGDNMETEKECYICGEYFNEDELINDKDDNLICQNCYDELQNEDEETYIECPYCEETFEDNEDIYDDDGYAVCPYCEGIIDTSEELIRENEIEFATSDWATEEVYEAYQNNLIPDEMLETALYKTISREEFAAVAVKLYEYIVGEIPDVSIYDTPFTDCNFASEYNNYIAAAYELGITKGTSNTAFSPYDNITREQLATMLCRTLFIASSDLGEDLGMDIDMLLDRLGRPELLDMEDTAVSFADENEISDFAKASVHILASRDIIKGVDDSHFAPKETATKEQSILISVRCVNNLLKNEMRDEERLLNAFIEQVVGCNSDYLYFLPDDYDGDGTLEAFGITGWGLGESSHSNVNIWFVNSDGECEKIAEDLYGELRKTIDTGTAKFMVWEQTADGSGSKSFIYGCNGNEAHEPNVSGEYEYFREENGSFVADTSDFSKGYHDWITLNFSYDENSMEFINSSSNEEPPESLDITDITYEIERIPSGNYEQYGILKATSNGSYIWTYITDTVPLAQLETISDVYSNGNTVYIVVNCVLIAIDCLNGQEKWRYDGVGASNSCVFDASGNIYISGFYGPDIVILDKNGLVLYKQGGYEEFLGVYDLKIMNDILYIYYEMENGGIKTIDISQFVNK